MAVKFFGEILDLFHKRNELQHKVVLAVQSGNPLDYIDVFSNTVPEIIDIDKQIYAWENKTGNSLDDFINKINLVSSGGQTEIEDFEEVLRTELMNRGFHSLAPDNKDRKRINDMLKKSDPEGAASRMQNATTHKDKLFRRGKQLMEEDRQDLAKGFWVKLGKEFGRSLPKEWGGSGVAPTGPSSVKIKTKEDYTESEKIEFFNSLMDEVSVSFREIVERNNQVEEKAISTFIRTTSVLGSEAVQIINKKLDS